MLAIHCGNSEAATHLHLPFISHSHTHLLTMIVSTGLGYENRAVAWDDVKGVHRLCRSMNRIAASRTSYVLSLFNCSAINGGGSLENRPYSEDGVAHSCREPFLRCTHLIAIDRFPPTCWPNALVLCCASFRLAQLIIISHI